MFNEEYDFFNKNSGNFKIALTRLKPNEINKTNKIGQTLAESLEEAIRDCKIICRRIEILRDRFSDEKDIPKSASEDLNKKIFLVKNYKLKELIYYCGENNISDNGEEDVKT